MEEDDRQRKLQAGKEKFAEFLRKKNSPKKRKRKLLEVGGDSAEVPLLDDGNVNKTASTSLQENYLLDSSIDGTSLEDVEITLSETTLDNSSWMKENASDLDYSLQTKQEAWGELFNENQSLKDQLYSHSNEEVHCTVKSDDLRETDYRSMIEEYRRRIEEFQCALSQRDDIISQLSDRLMVTLQNRDAIQMEAAGQADGLAQEISTLKLQLQQASEILSRQKDKDGISAEELLEAHNKIISLNQELHCVKESLNKFQQQNALLVQEIERTKAESSNEELKCQIDSLLKEKDSLSEEVCRLKCVEDELIQANEKSRLSDILIKQLKEGNNNLQEQNIQIKSELGTSVQQSADISSKLEAANIKIEELLRKQEKFETVLSESKRAEDTIEQLTSELNKTHKELDNAQKQFSDSQAQLEDINQKYIFLQEEAKKIHESYSLTIESTKEELKEKHEIEVEEKETTLKKLLSSVEEKLLAQEEKYRNEMELLESKCGSEVAKYKEHYNNILAKNEELENRIMCMENSSYPNKVSVPEKNSITLGVHS